jgi:DNA-binding response OmpR family regulator
MAILIADQSASVRSLMRLLLEGAGHAVREVMDSGRALAMTQKQQFAVVILDTGLTPEDGVETARRIHEARPLQSVVLMSHASDSSRLRRDASGVGVVDILTKPLVPHALLSLVRRLAEKASV